MLYYCAIAHPALMIRADKIDETFKYESSNMEDYRLWLSIISSTPMKFANLGSILLKLRKHDKNKSGYHTIEDEAAFKMPYLMRFI